MKREDTLNEREKEWITPSKEDNTAVSKRELWACKKNTFPSTEIQRSMNQARTLSFLDEQM
jgi:hypothetical protein